MPLLSDNPFAVLTFLSAPALLTNAMGLLTLSTSNRFGLAIERSRSLVKLPESTEDTAHAALHLRQTDRVELRIMLLLNALRAFYFSLGAFAAASLVSLLGAALASAALFTAAPCWCARRSLPYSMSVMSWRLSARLICGLCLTKHSEICLYCLTTRLQA